MGGTVKKQVITLNIGNYEPEITCLTLPFLKKWANKIGAEFNIIDKPVFHAPSVTYEKFQLYERSRGYDWTIFIDVDALVHPDTPDWTEMLGKDTVCFHGLDFNLNRFRGNEYTRRSKSLKGACTWLVMFSDWCRDLWHPMCDGVTFESCMENISPMVPELLSGTCEREHLIDDYLVTQNIARYGLHATTVIELCRQLGHERPYYHHLYACSAQHKIDTIKQRIVEWKL